MLMGLAVCHLFRVQRPTTGGRSQLPLLSFDELGAPEWQGYHAAYQAPEFPTSIASLTVALFPAQYQTPVKWNFFQAAIW